MFMKQLNFWKGWKVKHPVLDDKDAEYLIKECSLTKLLEISKCVDYLSYDDSIKRMPHFTPINHDLDLLGLNLATIKVTPDYKNILLFITN